MGYGNLVSLSRHTGHCRRLRDVTPQRLVCALVESLGALRVQTIADILRTFNAQNGLRTRYKAFYNRLAQPEFPVFLRQVYLEILRKLSQNVLRAVARDKLGHFTDVVVQDGSSFAVHDALAKTFGGRFTKIRPAAVELHTFASIFKDDVLNARTVRKPDGSNWYLEPPTAIARPRK
ncbi:MAG: hypothetical protein ACRD88_22100 [Terriglobia bacterium]